MKSDEAIILTEQNLKPCALSYEITCFGHALSQPGLSKFLALGDRWPWILAAPAIKIVLIPEPTQQGVFESTWKQNVSSILDS